MAGGAMIAMEAGKKGYPGKFTFKVFITCIVAATGGLIFGYDIGISGGVTAMPQFLEKFFPDVYRKEELNIGSTNQYCKFASQKLTLFTSSLYIAALVASLVASTVTRVFGRKFSMCSGGLLFLAGALVNGFAKNRIYLYVGRALLGIGVGFANQSVPVYLSEMAPYRHRGWLNMVFQLSITIGILVAYLINYFTAQMKSGQGWRWSLGCAGVPAIIFLAGSAVLPDTPNSLIERNKPEEAKKRLQKIRGIENVDEEFNDLINASNESKKIKHPWLKILFSRKYRPQLIFVVFIPFFQQLTGMNVFMFYAPVLFKTIGFGSSASLMSSVITGAVNTLATFVSMLVVDRLGRRVLFLQGGIQMLICQIIITVCIAIKFGLSGAPSELEHWYATLVVVAICVYVAGFAWSWGPLGWLVPSEILPLEIRSAGQSINVAVNMFFTFFIAEVYLQMMCHMKFGLFIFFAFFVFSMTIFIYILLPETKGIPIEEMEEIWKSHPCWKRYVVDENENENSTSTLEMTEEIKVVAKEI